MPKETKDHQLTDTDISFNDADDTGEIHYRLHPIEEGLYRRAVIHLAGAGTYTDFRTIYSKYHDAIIDHYTKAGLRAYRVLRSYGQDKVSANLQRFIHVKIMDAYRGFGFHPKDFFVLVRSNRPRKNHSYFLVFVQTGPSPRQTTVVPLDGAPVELILPGA